MWGRGGVEEEEGDELKGDKKKSNASVVNEGLLTMPVWPGCRRERSATKE